MQEHQIQESQTYKRRGISLQLPSYLEGFFGDLIDVPIDNDKDVIDWIGRYAGRKVWSKEVFEVIKHGQTREMWKAKRILYNSVQANCQQKTTHTNWLTAQTAKERTNFPQTL